MLQISSRGFGILLLLLVVATIPAAAQKFTGDISGNVTDASGGAIAGAAITVHSAATGLTRTASTSGTGSFRVPNLDVGSYQVSISAEGFKTSVQNADVTSNGLVNLDISMQVGERTEEVTVTAAAPLVDLSVNENSTLDNARIETIPLDGRDFNSLIALTPGVQRAPGGGFLAININGTRATSQNNLVDGLYNNDRFYGQPVIGQTGVLGVPATLIPMEALQEVNVQETPSAQFAVKGGAPVSLVLKSGTNEWHGSGLFLRHTSFADAKNFFATSGVPFRDMQGTSTIGGPIIKDKTFFFGYYDGQGYAAIIPRLGQVPTPGQITQARNRIATAGLTPTVAGENLLAFFPSTTDAIGSLITVRLPVLANMTNFGIIVDQKINQHHLLTGRYVYGDSTQSSPPSQVNSTVVQPAPQFNPTLFNSVAPTRGQLLGLSEVWMINSNQTLESRLGFTRFSQIIKTNNSIDPLSLGIDTGPVPASQDLGVPYVHMSAFSSIGGGGALNYPIVTRPDQTIDWSEHFTWVRGNHTIAIGGNFQHAYTNFSHDQARVQLSIDGQNFGSDPVDELVQLLLGKVDGASRYFGNTHRHFTQNTFGVYGQDEWKVTPRLTLTLGLRYDINGVVREKSNLDANFLPGIGLVQVGHGINSLYNIDPWNFGPRLGFGWDVFGKGKTAVRGGYSMSYDTPEIATFALPFLYFQNNAGAFLQPNLGVTQEILSTPATTKPETGSCANPTTSAPGDYICIDNATNGPVFGANPGGSPPFPSFGIVRNLKTPRYHQFNLGVQQELWGNNVLSVTYSGQRGQDLIFPIDINALPLGCGVTAVPCVRPFASLAPTLSDIVQDTNHGSSQYDSLQASFRQRKWHGINTQYNFTWSKCIDNESGDRAGEPQLNNPLDLKGQRGRCDSDVRLNFNLAGTFDLPKVQSMGRFGTGWEIGAVYTAESGRPFSVLLPFDPSGQGLPFSGVRASWDGTPVQINSRNPADYVHENYTAAGQPDPCGNVSPFAGILPLSPFYIPCAGTVGNSRRNQLIGPGLSQLDANIVKNTKIGERVTVQFRWEVFNVLNRANFGAPSNFLIPGGIFGQVTSTPDVALGNPVLGQGAARNMDFVLKVIF
jgi:outer membrane receptor protein involved in Fe transport